MKHMKHVNSADVNSESDKDQIICLLESCLIDYDALLKWLFRFGKWKVIVTCWFRAALQVVLFQQRTTPQPSLT